ncbi:uncharacterized protein LOC131011420 [Salvia miltiorrhiza]|uniref:uncharacterized protein LOC131011420 n=1 Tax=Salvia miltiorrhiza TaxID=226208 RepID=UPI0025AD8914|nr:uncharacterized protein LOC131011420 [Salvia miltiorrhiza]
MSENREWMYRRFLPDGALNPDFQRGLQGFIDYANSRRDLMDGEKIRCPCRKCDNIRFHTKNNVQYHIAKNGFVRDYHIWRFHGEIEMPTTEYHNFEEEEANEDNYQNMGKRKGVEPTECLYDAYEILHKNKDGTYIDERSRRIGEKVQDIVASQSQAVDDDSDPPEIDMNKVYVEAVGGLDKKKRMFGVGGLAASLRSSEQSSGTSQFQGPLVDPQQLMDVEQQLQDALVEIARQKEEMRQKDEQTDARFQAQQRMFEEILARLPPGPTPPTGPSS